MVALTLHSYFFYQQLKSWSGLTWIFKFFLCEKMIQRLYNKFLNNIYRSDYEIQFYTNVLELTEITFVVSFSFLQKQDIKQVRIILITVMQYPTLIRREEQNVYRVWWHCYGNMGFCIHKVAYLLAALIPVIYNVTTDAWHKYRDAHEWILSPRILTE